MDLCEDDIWRKLCPFLVYPKKLRLLLLSRAESRVLLSCAIQMSSCLYCSYTAVRDNTEIALWDRDCLGAVWDSREIVWVLSGTAKRLSWCCLWQQRDCLGAVWGSREIVFALSETAQRTSLCFLRQHRECLGAGKSKPFSDISWLCHLSLRYTIYYILISKYKKLT